MKFFALCFAWAFWVAFPLQAEPIRVLVFGDSLASGYGLPANDGFQPQLAEALEQLGVEVEMVDAAVAGETTIGAVSRLEVTYNQAHDVVILELGANDMLRAFPPKITRENLTKLIEESNKPVFLVGIRAFPTYGLAYAQSFDAIYPELAEQYKTGFYPFIFETVFEEGAATSWRYFQADRLHLNAKGIKLVVDDMAPIFSEWLLEISNPDQIKDSADFAQ